MTVLKAISLSAILNHPRLQDEGFNNGSTEVNCALPVSATTVMPDPGSGPGQALIRHPDAL